MSKLIAVLLVAFVAAAFAAPSPVAGPYPSPVAGPSPAAKADPAYFYAGYPYYGGYPYGKFRRLFAWQIFW